jgi:hypothetical protein
MVIIAGKPGQLGNMLILTSHFIARAIEDGYTVVNPAFDDYAPYFEGTRHDLLCRFPSRGSVLSDSRRAHRWSYSLSHATARALTLLGGGLYPLKALTIRDWTTVYPLDDPAFIQMARSRLVFVRGWLFRDPPAVVRQAEAIREYFRPLEKHRRVIAAKLEEARRDSDVLVGIHIRHGIIHFANARHYWYPAEQYPVFMTRMEQMLPGRRVKFLICSDTQQDPALFAKHAFTFGPNHLVEDMYSFAGCDYLIGPPSTYTMWASFYGGVPLYTVNDADHVPTRDDFRVATV